MGYDTGLTANNWQAYTRPKILPVVFSENTRWVRRLDNLSVYMLITNWLKIETTTYGEITCGMVGF